MEARQFRERLRVHADGFTEHAAKVPLAHTEVSGDGVHVGARQPGRGVEGELRGSATGVGESEAFGDRALQDRNRIDRAASCSEPLDEPPSRGIAPKILERDDAPGDRGGGHAEHGFLRAQAEARHHRPLSTANELSTGSLLRAERVDVDTTLRRRSEADDEVTLRTRESRRAACRASNSCTNKAATADAVEALGAWRW